MDLKSFFAVIYEALSIDLKSMHLFQEATYDLLRSILNFTYSMY